MMMMMMMMSVLLRYTRTLDRLDGHEKVEV